MMFVHRAPTGYMDGALSYVRNPTQTIYVEKRNVRLVFSYDVFETINILQPC